MNKDRLLVESVHRLPPSRIPFWVALSGEPVGESEWNGILARARREGVLPRLASLHPECPGRAAIRREAAFAHMTRVEHVRIVASALDRAGIPWIALKGLALATRLYRDPAERPSGDCDVLVRPDDRERAVAALRQAGFHPSGHHRELFLGESGEVDLHTHAVNRERVPARAKLIASNHDWFEGRGSLATDAGNLPVLDDAHLALFLALHLVHHHGAIGARWILDLHLLLEEYPAAAGLLSSGKAGIAGRTALFVARNLLAPGPAESREPGSEASAASYLDRITLHAAAEGADMPGLRFLLTLRELPASSRLSFLRQSLLPERDVLDSVAATGGLSPVRHHAARISRTAFSLARLAWRALDSSS